MIILPLLVLLLSYLVVYLSINSQKPRVAQYAKSAPPVLLIAWIIATCFIGNRYSIPSINIFLNIICIIAIVIGVFYMRDGRKLGFYSIVASSLLHISNSFLTKYDIETNVFIIIVDAFLILLLVLIVFLKNRNGNRWFDVMSFYSEPSIKTSFLRYYNILSIITFVFIMFVFPTYRSLHDDVRYFKTYYNEYDFYDNDGKYDYYKYLSVFSNIDKDRFEIKKINGNYYHVRPIKSNPSVNHGVTNDGNISTKNTLTGPQLFEKYNSAVFLILTSNGMNAAQGSGFFISEDGLAVSNYHVFKGSVVGFETIQLIDGSEYKVKEVIAKNVREDIIIFKVDAPNNTFNFIPIAKEEPKIGETVYAIGNPLGIKNIISEGLLSGEMNNYAWQINAEIDHGSSGGVLLNTKGEAIGITAGGMEHSGANLNYAIKIKYITKYLDSPKQEKELF